MFTLICLFSVHIDKTSGAKTKKIVKLLQDLHSKVDNLEAKFEGYEISVTNHFRLGTTFVVEVSFVSVIEGAICTTQIEVIPFPQSRLFGRFGCIPTAIEAEEGVDGVLCTRQINALVQNQYEIVDIGDNQCAIN